MNAAPIAPTETEPAGRVEAVVIQLEIPEGPGAELCFPAGNRIGSRLLAAVIQSELARAGFAAVGGGMLELNHAVIVVHTLVLPGVLPLVCETLLDGDLPVVPISVSMPAQRAEDRGGIRFPDPQPAHGRGGRAVGEEEHHLDRLTLEQLRQLALTLRLRQQALAQRDTPSPAPQHALCPA
jgi:hypothetical protein